MMTRSINLHYITLHVQLTFSLKWASAWAIEVMCSVFAVSTVAHLSSDCMFYEGILLAVRRCLMQKMLMFSANEFAVLLARIKQQSASIIDLVLNVFGGKLQSDGNIFLRNVCVTIMCKIQFL